jgi:hypothetical protein
MLFIHIIIKPSYNQCPNITRSNISIYQSTSKKHQQESAKNSSPMKFPTISWISPKTSSPDYNKSQNQQITNKSIFSVFIIITSQKLMPTNLANGLLQMRFKVRFISFRQVRIIGTIIQHYLSDFVQRIDHENKI